MKATTASEKILLSKIAEISIWEKKMIIIQIQKMKKFKARQIS